jgi:hypothetical protein
VQFTEKRYPEMAEVGYRLTTDAGLRAAVLAAQDERLRAFAPGSVEGRLKAHLSL